MYIFRTVFFHCTLYYPHVFLQHPFNHYFILYYSFVYNSFISSFIVVTNGLLLTVCDMNPYIVHLCISINISREWFTWNLSKNKKNSKTLWCKQLKYASENSLYFFFYQDFFLARLFIVVFDRVPLWEFVCLVFLLPQTCQFSFMVAFIGCLEKLCSSKII